MYTKTYQVHTYEVDQNNTLTLSALFHYLQDVMIENANSYGAGSDFHKERNLAWVLVDYDIDVYELPKVFDVLTCGTLPYSFKKFYGYRIYEVYYKDTLVAKGKARFVLMDTVSKQLALPSQDILDLFIDALKEPKTLLITKNKPFNGHLLKEDTIRVKNSDLDINNHMNNVKYIEYALDSINGYGYDLDRRLNVRITYKKEALLHDELSLRVYQNDTSLQVQFHKEDVIALVTFNKKDHSTE